MQITTVRQDKLSSECFFVQTCGLYTCDSCEYKDKKRKCGGMNIKKTGRNNLGVRIGVQGMLEEDE